MGKLFKSKTIDFNVLVTAIYAFLVSMGMDIPENVMVGVLAIGNFILRLITKEAISEK